MANDPSAPDAASVPPDRSRDAPAPQAARRRLLLDASALAGASLLPTLSAYGARRAAAEAGAPHPGLAAPAPHAAGPTVSADVSFRHVATAAQVDSHYSGLSYEKNKLAAPMFTGTNAALIHLFRLLGPSVLRIGANQVDRSSWNGAVGGLTAILPAHIDALAEFVQATQWKVIYAVNMARNTKANAAREAGYVASRLGSSVLAWEIGNEPDLYRRHGYRPDSWTYADYLAEWRTLRDAMRPASPGVPFSGPAASYDLKRYTLPFAKDEGARISILTQHYYRANGKDPGSTLELLLTPDPKLQPELSRLVKAAANAGTRGGMRYAEANSFYAGGRPNVSNAYGTAFWVMDFMFTCAVAGCTGVNLHGGGKGPGYTPIADNNGAAVEARPEYYGMLMFTQACPGTPMPGTLTTSDTIDASAWGVARADKGANFVLINKDASHSISMKIATGIAAGRFSPLWLEGPKLSATSGQTLGGASIGSDGNWAPQARPALAASADGMVHIVLPPATAVALRSVARS